MKIFKTPEECLEVMGEHCWGEIRSKTIHNVWYPNVRECKHCKICQSEIIQQSEIRVWKDIIPQKQ